ncbi:glycosyltransferase family 1 protein, partial [Pseudomonas aeruginosa]
MSRPLSIALISETYPPEVNGVANTLGRLHAGLQQLGHRVQVVRPPQPGGDGRRGVPELVLAPGWPLPGYPGPDRVLSGL